MSSLKTPPAHLLRIDSPIGRIEIGSNGEEIVSLSIAHDGVLPFEQTPESSDAVLEKAAAQLTEYFAGNRTKFDVPVKLEGTAFQLSIWEQLVSLDWGETVSYGELGLGTGRATAGRAVGGAVGANPVPIIVPCHRVLASDGRITGFSAGQGIPTKAWLLEHEGVRHNGAARSAHSAEALALFDEAAGAAESAAESSAATAA